MRDMTRAVLGSVQLEYEIRGVGDPVVLVHNGIGPDWFRPLLEEPVLTARYRLIVYHRAGYGGSTGLVSPLTFSREAANYRALMRYLEIDKAHVVGHSSSACIALQIALDAPDTVHSLMLLEPALLSIPSPPEVPKAVALYRAGNKLSAVDTFLRGTCGADYRLVLEDALPGALEQAITDADTFFGEELPALRNWTFGPAEARRVIQPVLTVRGDSSDVRFVQREKLLLEWLPNAEPFLLQGAGHLLHLQNPRGLAEGLAGFVARHPLGAVV